MVWVKGLHIISIVFWSASLIYLPILMAGHSPRLSNPEYLRLHGMVRNLYTWVASPAALLAIVSGTILIPLLNVTAPWFAAKLLFVAALAIIHARCGMILAKQSHSAERANGLVRAMRIAWPIVLFPCVLWLVLAKPRIAYQPPMPPVLLPDSLPNLGFTPLAHPPFPQRPAYLPASLLPTPAKTQAPTSPDPRDTVRQPDRTVA